METNNTKTTHIRKIILHILHSSTLVPATFNVSDSVSLKQEFQRMTDWFTHELFDSMKLKNWYFFIVDSIVM